MSKVAEEVPIDPATGEPYGWTQPLCRSCWARGHTYPPVVIIDGHRQIEECVDCGVVHADGIYVRRDPRTANYPSLIES